MLTLLIVLLAAPVYINGNYVGDAAAINLAVAPSPTATATPSATPTPSCIAITSPASGATVAGSVRIATNDTCAGAWFESLFVDGSVADSFPVGSVIFSSVTVANGKHAITVTSQSVNPNSVVLGSASIQLNVNNAATPSSSPAPSASPTPSTALSHLSNVGPQSTHGALHSDAYCAAQADGANFPETNSYNVNDGTGWNSNNQLWSTPAYFYTACGKSTIGRECSGLTGNYSGTTQDTIRWAACKWGMDEDWAYAESTEETGAWDASCAQMHGGSTCYEGGDCSNPDCSPPPMNTGQANLTATLGGTTWSVTNSSSQFTGPRLGCGNGPCNAPARYASSCTGPYPWWASWSNFQSKVSECEWSAWPMAAVSTAWGQDYRLLKFRGCMNGDRGSDFGSADYTNAVSAATSSPNGISSGTAPKYFPNETNLQYLALGCVATHYSGDWYSTAAQGYAKSFVNNYLTPKAWPGQCFPASPCVKGRTVP